MSSETQSTVDPKTGHLWDEAALRRAADVIITMEREYLSHVAKGLQAFHRMGWSLMGEGEYRRHRRRCPTCNPKGYTRPSPINRHEYRRRVRNRRRRAR